MADDSARLDYLTLLRLQAERVKQRLINGDDSVASSELMALQNVIEQVSPEPTHNVNIQFCKRLFGVCRHCGELSELDEELPPLDPPPSPKPPIPAADLKAQPKPELKLFTNVVPIKPDYAPPA